MAIPSQNEALLAVLGVSRRKRTWNWKRKKEIAFEASKERIVCQHEGEWGVVKSGDISEVAELPE